MKKKPFIILAIFFGILAITAATNVQAYQMGPYWLTLGSDQYTVTITDLPSDSGINIDDLQKVMSEPDWLAQFLNEGQITFQYDNTHEFTVEDPNASGGSGNFPGIGNWFVTFSGPLPGGSSGSNNLGPYPLNISDPPLSNPLLGSVEQSPIPTPEPSTLFLLGIGLCGLPWLKKLLPRR